MKKLIKTLGFILAVAGPSIVMAAPRTDQPQGNVNTNPNEIRNKVCIESPQTSPKCDQVKITIKDNGYACESLTSSGSIVELNVNGQGSMRFTCKASDSNPHKITIDCGNGQEKTESNVSSLSYACRYSASDEGRSYNVTCLIDNEQTQANPACIKNIGINPGIYGICGNGIIEPGEDCDLKGSDGQSILIHDSLDYYGNIGAGQYANNGYSCKNCKIIGGGGNFVYEPAECLYTDTPISLMNNEVLPYWWRLWIKDTQRVVDDDAYCSEHYQGKTSTNDITILRENSMKCHFAVYNGKHNQSGSPIMTFVEDCFNTNFEDHDIYRFFDKYHQTSSDGAHDNTVFSITNTVAKDEFGEYKLVLERVEYDYCNKTNGKWEPGKRYGAVCEVNFAVTRPYVMQISTFGVTPVGTTAGEFLTDFRDIQGEKLLKRTDLSDVINTDGSSYEVESNVRSKFDAFKDKYDKLAVKVDMNNVKINGTSLQNIFKNATEVRKVPNQSIYFIKGNGTLVLEQEKIKTITSAYTIIVEGMDVEIKGNVLQYAMIVTDGNMKFTDIGDSDGRCAKGGQVVQGIYVALDGFEGGEKLRNTDIDEEWCARGGLHVKGVLIGDGIEDLMGSRRSQLNSWFNVSSLSNANRERRQKLIEGAAILIEYNPSLWKTLPPGAEIFTESLEVYRK